MSDIVISQLHSLDVLDDVIEFLSGVFGDSKEESRPVQNFIVGHEPSLSKDNIIVARHNEALIGVVRFVERGIYFGDDILQCGGISSVAVAPRYRRKGVCSKLMALAHEIMVQKGLELAVLHGRKSMDGFYVPFGYCGVNRYGCLELLPGPRPLGCDVHFHECRASDLEMLRAWYERVHAVLPGSMARTEKYWAYLYQKIINLRSYTVLRCASPNAGETLGYVVLGGDTVVEAAVDHETLPGLIGGLAKRGVSKISLHPFHPLMSWARTHMSTLLTERFCLDGGYMAKVLDEDALIRKVWPMIMPSSSESQMELLSSIIDDDIIRVRFLLGMLSRETYLGSAGETVESLFKGYTPTGFHTSDIDDF